MRERLSIACPAYNESEGIVATLTRWVEYLQDSDIAHSYEIVVCNDGSTDRTGILVQELSRQYPIIKIIHHPVNRGAAAAMATAIAHTTGDWVLLLDSDGQFPVENLEPMWKCVLQSQADAVIGYRVRKEDSAFARLGSRASNLVCGLIYGRRLRDFNSALQLVRGPLLRSLPLEARGLNNSTEIASRLLELQLEGHLTLLEAPARHLPRHTGRSSRKLFRDSWHRFLFVMYLGVRRFLQKQNVIQPARLHTQENKISHD